MKDDPDRYYHFAISRAYAEHGFREKVQQADDIGWGDSFGEKEYLLHVFIGLGSKLARYVGLSRFSWGLFTALAATFGITLGLGAGSLWFIPLGALAMCVPTGPFFCTHAKIKSLKEIFTTLCEKT